MRSYRPRRPLIFIHMPKTGGTSVRDIVQDWFPRNFHLNYYDEIKDEMPRRVALLGLRSLKAPLVIYGHFNRSRGFGVEAYYPQVTQFMTILRDPFEAAVSDYHFSRRVGANHAAPPLAMAHDIEPFFAALETDPLARRSSLLQHFPRVPTEANYKDLIEEFFVEIGVTEKLPESLARMARALGTTFDAAALTVKNATPRDQDAPEHVRTRFQETHRLEYEIYAYVRAKFPP